METRVKRRVIPLPFSTVGSGYPVTYRNWIWLDGYYDAILNSFVPLKVNVTDRKDAFRHLVGSQVTVSQNHPLWKTRVPGLLKGDYGGPFFSQKRYVSGTNVSARLEGTSWIGDMRNGNFDRAILNGGLLPCAPIYMEYPPDSSSKESSLKKLGATAISRCSPSSPAADLSTFLGETVKEGIPKIIGATLRNWRRAPAKQIRKDLSSEYLNYEFGWKPFVSDLMSIADVITRADDIWRQYERDAGKVVRRRYEFPVFEEKKYERMNWVTNPFVIGPDYGPLYDWSKKVGYCVREHSITRRQWFSGAFTYYLPTSDSKYGVADIGIPGRETVSEAVLKAKKTFGLTLTPATVWNLMPWSWAIDWFSNVGDVLDNWSNWALDGQVLKYGYMMEHTIDKYTYTWVGDTYYKSTLVPPSVSCVVETKQRIKAGPYGFGLDWSGLTPRQLAITGALGINKSHK